MSQNTPNKGRGGRRHRLVYNNDRGFFYYLPPSTGIDGIVEEIVGRLRGTQIDTLVARIDRGNLVPMFDSRIEGKVGKGETSFPTVEVWRHVTAMRRLFDQGIDPWTHIFDAIRDAGMAAFTSIRMNDLHHTKMKRAFTAWDSFYISDIARNPKYYIGEDYGHYCEPGTYSMAAKLLNFAHDEVRQHRIAIVEEIVERYDIDGFELDFQRHGLYLPKAQVEAGTPLMTDMIRRIRTIFDRFENERGHPICLMVRVPSWLELCQRMGFDLKTWIEEGLVDMIAASSVAQTELDAPLEDFVALAQGTPCEIFGTLEYISQPPYEKYLPEMGRAGAAWYHHCGVDGIYFENDHHHYEPYLDANTGEPRVVQPVEHRSLYNELHDPQALRWRSKRYVVSAEHMPWPSFPKPLPTSWERSQEGETKRFSVKMADDMEPAIRSGRLEAVHLRLILLSACEEDRFDATFNGHALPAEKALAVNLRGGVHSHGDMILIQFSLLPDWVIVGENGVEIALSKANSAIADPIVLIGVEVDVNYRRVPLKLK